MKKIFWRSLLLCVLCLASSGTSAETCVTNKYIQVRKQFPRLPLKTIDTPEFVKGFCGEEWTMFGTCCQHWDLLPHLENDRLSIMEAANKTILAMTYLKDVVPSLFLKMKQLALATDSPLYASWSPQIKFAQESFKTHSIFTSLISSRTLEAMKWWPNTKTNLRFAGRN